MKTPKNPEKDTSLTNIPANGNHHVLLGRQYNGSRDSYKFNIDGNFKGLKTSILNHLKYTLARDTKTACTRDWWLAVCYAVRDRILERYIKTQYVHHTQKTRRIYYLSLEYMMGRLLRDSLFNTGLYHVIKEVLLDLNLDIHHLLEEEEDMGLGNGGLGRLAACFLDSLASLDYPAIGYGIHYEYGLFKQVFVNERQHEHPDNWLNVSNPWQIARPEYVQKVRLYGHVENNYDSTGCWAPKWVQTNDILGIPWDIPIVGYGGHSVNFLRLWESRSTEDFDLQVFNEGGYVEAVRDKALSETVSKVLYPNDSTEIGKELRLVQQYFFVSCSLQDIIRRFKTNHNDWSDFPEKVVIQLNDTHPTIAIAELMYLLMDKEKLEWDKAWCICQSTFNYTNHTLLPEALEKWSVPLLQKVLPRHLQIIFEINHRFLEEIVETRWPGNEEMKRNLSIIEEGNPQMIRMAYLAVVCCKHVNGVAALHTELLKANLFHNFNILYPNKFQNKTNGITPRRWLRSCNPKLAKLIDKTIGDSWTVDLDQLHKLEPYAEDSSFQKEFDSIKHFNKEILTKIIQDECDVNVSPDAIFDVQIKRLHEYKRQHLNLLHILTLYHRIIENPNYEMHPRVFIFGAKAAPGYYLAKEIIYAINSAARKINNDPRVKDKLKIAFLPNYRVTLAERIIPAANVSEQISTAGKEASGTGNMKLALNGALTIGTLDGANVEIQEEVGQENIFIFGKTVEEVQQLKATGYSPWEHYNNNHELKAILDWLGSDFFTHMNKDTLGSLRNSLLEGGDPYLVLADYEDYCNTQAKIDEAYQNRQLWNKMAIMNTARVGKFSSDRTIREYARDIWNLEPVNIPI